MKMKEWKGETQRDKTNKKKQKWTIHCRLQKATKIEYERWAKILMETVDSIHDRECFKMRLG
jgi:hypothetical protein